MTESPGIVHEVDREPRTVVFAWLPGDRRVVTRKNPAWLGWTLNLANPRSWVVVAVILVVWRWTRRS